MATKRSVILNGYDLVQVNELGVASAQVKPGYLVKGVSSIAHQTGTTQANLPKAVAMERDELGQGIDNTRQTSGTGSAYYAAGDTVKVGVVPPGVVLTMFVASGQNISEDDPLESAGDGTLAEGSTAPMFRAMETTGEVFEVTAIKVQAL